jgi:hypothetical protein
MKYEYILELRRNGEFYGFSGWYGDVKTCLDWAERRMTAPGHWTFRVDRKTCF